MRLIINNVGRHDYGQYKCVAKNALGETDGTILLQSKFPAKHPVYFKWHFMDFRDIKFFPFRREQP